MAQVKVMIFIPRKPGISVEQFREHYEKVHAPLAVKLLPMIKEYRRNHLDRNLKLRDGSSAALDFDVVTEMEFASEDDYAAFRKRLADPDVSAQVRADEANFIDGPNVRHVIVRECVSLGD